VAEDVGKLRASSGIKGGGESGLELSGKRNVRKSDALACEEGTADKMPFEDGEGGSQTVLKYTVDLKAYRHLNDAEPEIPK
jgi:hypothetical protein